MGRAEGRLSAYLLGVGVRKESDGYVDAAPARRRHATARVYIGSSWKFTRSSNNAAGRNNGWRPARWCGGISFHSVARRASVRLRLIMEAASPGIIRRVAPAPPASLYDTSLLFQ